MHFLIASPGVAVLDDCLVLLDEQLAEDVVICQVGWVVRLIEQAEVRLYRYRGFIIRRVQEVLTRVEHETLKMAQV